MPKVLFRDNYCFELTSMYLNVYKYDLYNEDYIRVDQCYLRKIPCKYMDIISEFNAQGKTNTYALETSLRNIKLSI